MTTRSAKKASARKASTKKAPTKKAPTKKAPPKKPAYPKTPNPEKEQTFRTEINADYVLDDVPIAEFNPVMLGNIRPDTAQVDEARVDHDCGMDGDGAELAPLVENAELLVGLEGGEEVVVGDLPFARETGEDLALRVL